MDFLARLIDSSDPFSSGNVTLYFVTVFVYVYSAVSIWLSQNWAWRLICFILNQFFTVGAVVTWPLVLTISARYWLYALAMVAIAIVGATVPHYVAFRRELRRKYYF